MARLGETYLIAAEVLIRQGEYQQALEYINDLRARAAYKEEKIVLLIVMVGLRIMRIHWDMLQWEM